MAKTTPVKNAWRSLTWMGVIIVLLVLLLAAGVLFFKASIAPKLGLDLEGGTQIILAPELSTGQQVSNEQLDQAVAIIRQRVNASGVSEAEVSTQGAKNIVVSIPGKPDKQTEKKIEQSAKLEFRPVLVTGAPSSSSVGSGSPTPTPQPTDLRSTPTVKPTNGSDLNYVTPALQAKYEAYDCAAAAKKVKAPPPEDEPLITCEQDGSAKYILGPVEVQGKDITDATNGMAQTQAGSSTGQWVVNIKFNSQGGSDFQKVSSRLISLDPPRNQFAAVLDGEVITAPRVQGVTNEPQIYGDFTQESSKALADQLKFGALPISFQVQSSDHISATLGSSQLRSGLIAGLVGLLLVVIYTLFQYRLLGFVTITSLGVAALLTYLVIDILAWREGYRLSLSGVAGLIVAIGFTADSFIVYFERIRDELRDGRALVSAVEAGWKRAKHTIYAAKATNLLAAIVLWALAVGNVKGFAFTLGVTTVIDVVIVVLFTHPALQLLAQTRFFNSGHPWSGLDPNALGAVYRGAGRFRAPETVVSKTKIASSSREAAKRQTIAERKAAERAAAAGGDNGESSDNEPVAAGRRREHGKES